MSSTKFCMAAASRLHFSTLLIPSDGAMSPTCASAKSCTTASRAHLGKVHELRWSIMADKGTYLLLSSVSSEQHNESTAMRYMWSLMLTGKYLSSVWCTSRNGSTLPLWVRDLQDTNISYREDDNGASTYTIVDPSCALLRLDWHSG